MIKTLICDCECFRDFFSVSFMNVKTREVEHWGPDDRRDLVRKILKNNRIVTFNGTNYDLPMLSVFLDGHNVKELKTCSDQIIQRGARPWDVARAYGVPQMQLPNHIDLIEVAPGIASLKIYAGRMHARHLQDLPIDPDEEVGDRVKLILDYCEKDLRNTRLLFKRLLPQLKLRQSLSKQYGQDLLSKSDAQIAEAVITSELQAKTKRQVHRPDFQTGYRIKYKAPEFLINMGLVNYLIKDIEADSLIVADGSGKIVMPKSLKDRDIPIGDTVYRMGIGGLHSQEKKTAHVPDDDEFLLDFDVASYYPAIILKCRLYPKHLGRKFLSVYEAIVEQRLKAKQEGDKIQADTLKITINGSFGKFGSRYSILYSPDLLIQTTVTGQLCLLTLIHMIEHVGGSVVSANTDGVVVRVNRKKAYKRVKHAVQLWERDTGFTLEEAQYSGLYSRDVNNYIAIKPDGTHKSKGAYGPVVLSKNPTNPICNTAAIEFLKTGKSPEETVLECDDIRQFVSLRTVKGGALYKGELVGKAVRWYYSTESDEAMHYKLSGNKVPRTDGARPLMELPKEIPDDLDRYWYVAEAESILSDVGAGLI